MISHKRSLNLVTGVIAIVSGDDWSEQAINEHFDELERMAADARARHGIARVLADLTKTSIRPSETAELYRRRASALYHSTDRLAMVTESQLYRMQLKRTMPLCEAEVFGSVSEAMSWLLRATPKAPE